MDDGSGVRLAGRPERSFEDGGDVTAAWSDRFALRWIVPIGVGCMFDLIVQAFVYRTVRLPPLRTWWRVRRLLPARVAMRRETAREVLEGLLGAGAIRRGHVPPFWRRVAAVSQAGIGRAG